MASRPPNRLIAHLDMDAFYASVELLRRPALRGLPVVIGGPRKAIETDLNRPPDQHQRLQGYAGRGVITTATYEARALGVHSGMGLMRAAALAPQAILLPADFEEYRRLSRQFKAAVAELAPAIEDRGIDEVYIDLSDLPGARDAVAHDPLGGARALVQQIKNNVRQATGLSCSICLAPNKLLAKIGSDLDKPDGLTMLMAEDLPTRIWPLPVRRIHGVGPKGAEQLEALGVASIGDLAHRPLPWLAEHFGANHGAWLLAAANGQDDRPVVVHSEPVSMSRETTFERDLHPRNDRAQLTTHFSDLCQRVAADLQRKGYVGRTIGIKLRFDDFRTVTRDHTVPLPTANGDAILAAARDCLKRVTLSRRLRLLGVRVGNLSRPGTHLGPDAGIGIGAEAEPPVDPIDAPREPAGRPQTMRQPAEPPRVTPPSSHRARTQRAAPRAAPAAAASPPPAGEARVGTTLPLFDDDA